VLRGLPPLVQHTSAPSVRPNEQNEKRSRVPQFLCFTFIIVAMIYLSTGTFSQILATNRPKLNMKVTSVFKKPTNLVHFWLTYLKHVWEEIWRFFLNFGLIIDGY
jgi:hypothetical protein